jgi:membrane protein YqaA with SNARE-associated domain
MQKGPMSLQFGISVHLDSARQPAFLQVAHQSVREITRNKSHFLRWLMSFGALGVFFVAIIDSSVIPLPLPGSTDLLLLLLASQRGSTVISALWLASSAFAGSLLGGYFAWSAGRKGGEVTLERYIPTRYLRRITGWVQRHGPWSVAVAAILPPPIPLTPFVIAAGALKVTRAKFLIAFAVARSIRYGFLAWLGLTYGRHIVRVWQANLSGWSHIILWSYSGLVLAGILFGIWKYRQNAQRSAAGQPA